MLAYEIAMCSYLGIEEVYSYELSGGWKPAAHKKCNTMLYYIVLMSSKYHSNLWEQKLQSQESYRSQVKMKQNAYHIRWSSYASHDIITVQGYMVECQTEAWRLEKWDDEINFHWWLTLHTMDPQFKVCG